MSGIPSPVIIICSFCCEPGRAELPLQQPVILLVLFSARLMFSSCSTTQAGLKVLTHPSSRVSSCVLSCPTRFFVLGPANSVSVFRVWQIVKVKLETVATAGLWLACGQVLTFSPCGKRDVTASFCSQRKCSSWCLKYGPLGRFHCLPLQAIEVSSWGPVPGDRALTHFASHRTTQTCTWSWSMCLVGRCSPTCGGSEGSGKQAPSLPPQGLPSRDIEGPVYLEMESDVSEFWWGFVF